MGTRKTMKRHLRKSKDKKEDAHGEQFWRSLHSKTLERAKEREKENLVEDLLTFKDRPERILRRLSIISEKDLERELPEENLS